MRTEKLKASEGKHPLAESSLGKTMKKALIALSGTLTLLTLSAGESLAFPPPQAPAWGMHAHGPGNHGGGNGHGWGPGGKHASVRPPRPGRIGDQRAYEMISQNLAAAGDCSQLGESLRRLSNRLLTQTAQVNTALSHIPPAIPGDLHSQLHEQARRRVLTEMLQNTEFWTGIWDRLAEMYRSCDMECFDDGAAIGEISGLGYCSASVQAGGLLGPGLAFQPPMPVCQTAINIGCQQAYHEAARTFEGCDAYSTGSYQETFNEYFSQDCDPNL
ncbi:MAG TPA: hypothetical protein VL588_12070 [Bdellovibrionota bacterium]|jgi:hypothetical protein|nr:hypothetical protein [Bdellovibrionota bacterium]